MPDRIEKRGAPKRGRKGGRAAGPSQPGHGQTLQTLERGLQALILISQHENGLSIAELSAQLGVDRAIGYRLAATLEANGFVKRRADGQLCLGAELLSLAARFEPQLRAAATPLVQQLAQRTRAAAFISVPQGNACVAIIVAEPEAQLLRLSYRVGSRHPLSLGAAGIAILAGRPPADDDTEAVREARRQGYSVTRDQLQRGAVGVACPIHGASSRLGFEASVGVVALEGLDVARAAVDVVACARQIVDAVNSATRAEDR
ncbi:MAG: IclR family transcriptional regulator [Xanthobacteraceae bacterium]